MLIHCVALVFIMGIVRELTKQGLNNFIIIFWQNVYAFGMIVPYTLVKSGFPKTRKLHLHIGRTFTGISSGLCLFYGLSKIHLNTATAITFTGPLFSTIFAIIFLREKTYFHRIIGLSVGFVGVLIVLQPGTDAFDPNALFLVLTAALWGGTDMFIKLMNRTESVGTIMFYRAILMLVFTTPFLILFHQKITTEQWFLLFLLTCSDMANSITAVKAYKYADISVLMPFDFSRLVFSSIFAYIIFSETLDIWTVLGSLVIVSGTAFVFFKEKKRPRIISTETI